jgi:cobalt/nickel transport system permease protein
MITETFAFNNSAVHRMDPRLRVLSGALYSLVVALSGRFEILGAALALAVLLAAVARLSPAAVLKRLAVVNSLVLFLWVVLPFTYQGNTWFYMGPFPVTREGVLLCTTITLKSNAIVLWSIVFFSTMPVAVLGHALNCLKIPANLVALLLMTYRYIFVLESERIQLVRAVRMRCFSPGTNLHTYRTYAYMVGMLLVRAADQGERVHQAMLCRGFSGKFHCLTEMSFKRSDTVWAIALCIMIFSLAIFQWVL